MNKMTLADIVHVSKPTKPSNLNFELHTYVNGVVRGERQNYGTVLQRLQNAIEFSQREESSRLLGFSIAEVVRDNDDFIVNWLLIDTFFNIEHVESYTEWSEVVDIFGQGSSEPTGLGVNGFEVQFDILFRDKKYHLVFQTLERSDNMRTYSGLEMTTASKYGCDSDQSNEVGELDEGYSIIQTLQKFAENECRKWFNSQE